MKILRETQHDILVIKPAGLAMETRDHRMEMSLLSQLKSRYPDKSVKLPHRLDKITRGVALVTLSDAAVRYYNNEIQHGLWEKYYLARIHTPPAESERTLLGLHRAFLKQRAGKSVIVRSGGLPSKLEVLAVKPAPKRRGESHVLIRLFTGRYHQIRCMLEGLGFPLVGDPLYPGKGVQGRQVPCYLEHIVLRFRDFSSGELLTAHCEDDPDRESLDGAMANRILELVS